MVPIFYQVDPSDVRKLRGSFGVAFARHDTQKDEVRSWRSALTKAADFSGWVSRDFVDDAELIEKVVEDVVGKLTHISPALIEYDVFINFRGEDTRRGFVSHLYRALHQNSLHTYIDAKALRKGDPLSELLIAARESKISLLVISENYASSTWCLKELVEIGKSRDTKNRIVIPIFYNVNPSDVRKLKRSFAKAFAKHANDSSAATGEVQSWRSALRSATSLACFDSQKYQNEAELIEDIVEQVSKELIRIVLKSSKGNGLVEMDSHMHEMHLLLHPHGVETNDVRVVGIYGTGGLGKTTIAGAVYDEIANRFEAAFFFENVKEGFMKLSKLHVLRQHQRSILGHRAWSSYMSNKSFQMMLERTGKRKVLLVVGNVHKVAQIEDLLGKQHSFGGGSKIIITTRDVQLLSGADAIYEPKIFSDPGALELFRWYAFGTNQPTTDYDDLSRSVIQHAQGLPLALKVLGAFLYNRTVHEWEDVSEKLRKIPEGKIHDVLKTSFDGLDDINKDVFLDIACFFKGMHVDSATKIMLKYGKIGIHPSYAIRVLIDRALITVSKWMALEMPHSLEEMGREIVLQESLKEPERQSRLRKYEDVDLESWARKPQ
ncbi:hypothetical protein C1H46_044068 [Malus baccata]|uniref:TIR domain-containing protein n=1 Tax=Malus baccata TaxID=106549 RepID=A0A540K853_MALBA|nr:hypothetical protein C1H46_044068 [Malus baccata]